jgi:hypothetical protein
MEASCKALNLSSEWKLIEHTLINESSGTLLA